MKQLTYRLLKAAQRNRAIVHRHHPCRKDMAAARRLHRRVYGRKSVVQWILETFEV